MQFVVRYFRRFHNFGKFIWEKLKQIRYFESLFCSFFLRNTEIIEIFLRIITILSTKKLKKVEDLTNISSDAGKKKLKSNFSRFLYTHQQKSRTLSKWHPLSQREVRLLFWKCCALLQG